MTSHIYHERDNGEILMDGCPRCEEQAQFPLTRVDPDRMAALWREMVYVEKGGERDHYLSAADANACRYLYLIAIFLERFTDVDPWTLFEKEGE